MIISFFAACKAKEFNDPIEPVIKLVEINQVKDSLGIDSVIKIAINFTDGDGDIGLGDGDTISPFRYGEAYFNNLWIKLDYKDGSGNWITADDDSLLLSQRLENVTPNGKLKSLRGEINFYVRAKPTPTFSHKIIKLTIQLVDRALHKSNLIESQEINLNI